MKHHIERPSNKPEDNLASPEKNSTKLANQQLITRRKALSLLAGVAIGSAIYKGCQDYLTVESITFEELPDSQNPNLEIQDQEPDLGYELETTEPDLGYELETTEPEETQQPSQIQTPNPNTEPQTLDPRERECLKRQLYKQDGRVNMEFLRAAVNHRLKTKQ